MIIYESRTWLGPLTHWLGTVLPEVAVPIVCVAIWSYVVYVAQLNHPYLAINVGNGDKILGAFVTFFLVFRTNQAYRRYWNSNNVLRELALNCRELHQQFIVYTKGGQRAKKKDVDSWERLATTAKTDATRLLLAFCVTFKMHSRMAYDGYMLGEIEAEKKQQVDFDVARLRGLLSLQEWTIVKNMVRISDKPTYTMTPTGPVETYEVETSIHSRASHAIVFWLRNLINLISLNAKGWGWVERSLNLSDGSLQRLLKAFEAMDQNICTPLPLPYCHLCKCLMFTYVIFYPVVGVTPEQGLVANITIPCIISLAMFGLEVISMEIEDPFGEDPNDFDVMRIISSIEGSIFEMMRDRNDPAFANFAKMHAPAEYTDCDYFIALRSERSAVIGLMPGCSSSEREMDGARKSILQGAQFARKIYTSQEDYQPLMMRSAKRVEGGGSSSASGSVDRTQPLWQPTRRGKK